MNWFRKHVTHPIYKGLRKGGLSRTAAHVFSADSGVRALQRSHRFHDAWFSSSESNHLTKYYNRLMKRLVRSTQKSAAHNTGSNSASSYQSQIKMPSSVAQRLDYDYRRLSDLA